MMLGRKLNNGRWMIYMPSNVALTSLVSQLGDSWEIEGIKIRNGTIILFVRKTEQR